jgi:DNA repair exonuclease SbcCD ATPase subunit
VDLRAQLQEKVSKVGETLNSLKSASAGLNAHMVQLSFRRGQLEEALKTQIDINKVLQESQLYTSAIGCLQNYITQALQSIAIQVEDHMNAELARFADLSCKVNLTKTSSGGETMPACYLSLFRGGYEYTNDMLSSGELALLSIVFKLVLSTLKGGIDLLFVDEGLDALDEVNRERALSLLETSNHQQVFIISHREDAGHLKSAQKIILRKVAGETQAI